MRSTPLEPSKANRATWAIALKDDHASSGINLDMRMDGDIADTLILYHRRFNDERVAKFPDPLLLEMKLLGFI